MFKIDPKEYTLFQRGAVAAFLMTMAYIVFVLDVPHYTVALNNEIEASKPLLGAETSDHVISRAKRYFYLIDVQFKSKAIEASGVDSVDISRYSVVNRVYDWFQSLGTKIRLLVYQACF